MKILTMNLWHGLSPSNLVVFEKLEPESRREMREGMQMQLLRDVNPDIALLQEVNPVTDRFHKFSKDLDWHGVYQPDLAGLKILGLGFPMQLFSGLTIFAKPAWPLQLVKSVSLSGRHAIVNRWLSLQLKEERFALFAESLRPSVGRILVINTHLHHGLEATDTYIEAMSRTMEELDVSQTARSEIMERIRAGNKRRAKEMTILLKEYENIRKRYSMVILGGDFNSEPEGEIGQRLRELGFVDAWKKDHPDEPGYTYDREQNMANHILQDRFPLTFMVEDLSFSAKTNEALMKLATAQERRPRRIDHLWVKCEGRKIKSIRSRLVGLPNAEGMAPSDHFGVVADLDIE